MSFHKYGEVTTDSHSDFNTAKKAVYLDELGTGIADEDNKDKLIQPVRIAEDLEPKQKKS
jgi:hypothetical protein